MQLKEAMLLAEQTSRRERAKSDIRYGAGEGVWIEIFETKNGEARDYNLDGIGQKVVAVEATAVGVSRRWY